MKFKNPLLVVTNMEASKTFYRKVLGLRVVMDFGANVTLTGGVCLQTKESWLDLIHAEKDRISFAGMNAELYFEEDAFDAFLEKSGIRQLNTRGGNALYGFMIPTGILLRLERIWKRYAGVFLIPV